MKIIIFFCALLFACNISTAQSTSYSHFEWEAIGLSLVKAMGPELGYGIGIHTEPRYNLTDNLSISLRGDINIFDNQATNESLKLGFFSSAVLLGDYYFKNDKNSRVFTGLGFGYFTEDNQSLGIVPRIGYEFLIFRLTADYNYTFNEFTSEYFSIKMALNFGGKLKSNLPENK